MSAISGVVIYCPLLVSFTFAMEEYSLLARARFVFPLDEKLFPLNPVIHHRTTGVGRGFFTRHGTPRWKYTFPFILCYKDYFWLLTQVPLHYFMQILIFPRTSGIPAACFFCKNVWLLTWKSKFQCKSKFHRLLNFADFAGVFLTKSLAFCYN